MLARHGKVFRLERHMDRLLETVKLLQIHTDATRENLASGCETLLKANDLADSRMRITLTPGSIRGGEPTTLITADELPDYPRAWYDTGIAVVVSSFRQVANDPTFGYKTGCYLPRLMARQEAAAKGAEEAFWFTTDNRLAEACFCNVFCVLDGTVMTPPRDTPVLPGVVRGAVAELCKQLDIPHDDATPLTVHEMLAANEVFLTSSTMLLRPVVQIERHAVGNEKPGPITKRLMKALDELVDKECGKQPTH
jgi:branched-chain amino acid aminotransferase